MIAIHHVETLSYSDGPQVFAARDDSGGQYIAVMVAPNAGHDQYLVAGVKPERLRQFRSGALNLLSLLTERTDKECFLVKANDSLDEPLVLQSLPTASAESSYLPADGNDPITSEE